MNQEQADYLSDVLIDVYVRKTLVIYYTDEKGETQWIGDPVNSIDTMRLGSLKDGGWHARFIRFFRGDYIAY
jgi:hypothetical protein